MLDPGWLRDKVGSRVVTTICMCYERRPGSSLVPRIHVIALNFTGRSAGRREGHSICGRWCGLLFIIFFQIIP